MNIKEGMQNIMRRINSIIFDVGGVIVNLDTDLTIAAFKRLSSVPFESLYNPLSQTDLFNQFDKGLISGSDFFAELRRQLHFNGRTEDLHLAWNAMLRGVPESRLDTLVAAKQNYRTFLLSNTNEVHLSAFEKDLYTTNGVRHFSDYFDATYYSCRLGMRKPEKQIFEHVLQENDLDPSETIFIDDTVMHVKAAGECGIKAHLLPPGKELGDFLSDLGLL